VDATYGFLKDLLRAERSISFYPFLESQADGDASLGGLRGAIAAATKSEAARGL